MDAHDIVKEIKSQFRLYMNGTVSKSMRDKGLDYKINWGIDLPRLKEIAANYEPNHNVAQALWKEHIRECKILAGMLQPIDTFYPDIADIWVEDMHNPEMVQMTCMNLFQYLPYASEKAFQWMADEREYFQLCGFTLMARLLMKNRMNERAEHEFLDQALTAIEGDSHFIAQAAANALRKYAEQGSEHGKQVCDMLSPLLSSKRGEVSALANEIKSDIEYLF